MMPRERVDALVREYHGSGQTMARFARQAGVRYSTFVGWVHGGRASANGKGRVRFAELQLPASNLAVPGLSVTFPDGLVIRGGDSQELAALVRALRS